MKKYRYQLDTRLDGKYYCSIYQHGIPLPIAVTDDYDKEGEAIEEAESIILENRLIKGEVE